MTQNPETEKPTLFPYQVYRDAETAFNWLALESAEWTRYLCLCGRFGYPLRESQSQWGKDCISKIKKSKVKVLRWLH